MGRRDEADGVDRRDVRLQAVLVQRKDAENAGHGQTDALSEQKGDPQRTAPHGLRGL